MFETLETLFSNAVLLALFALIAFGFVPTMYDCLFGRKR